MPVESPVNYISDLVSTNPPSTDGLGQADDHLRLIKTALLQSFPHVNGAVSTSLADLNAGYVPVGGIIMWSGAISAIPANWHLCDGTNGTVNLLGKFVYGAASDSGTDPVVAATGGSATVAVGTTSDGSHSHTGASGAAGTHDHGGASNSHVLLQSEMPSHTHSGTLAFASSIYTMASSSPNSVLNGGVTAGAGSTSYTTNATGSGAGHQHGITTDGNHSHSISTDGTHTHTVTVATLPPYLALAYIQRIS